jgi:hypothetical protein
MRYLWRRLTKRCISCGQKLNSKQTAAERLAEINNKSIRLTEQLGKPPQVQNCKKCNRIIFEGEQGFVQSLLLIDMVIGRRPKKKITIWPKHSNVKVQDSVDRAQKYNVRSTKKVSEFKISSR